MPPRRFVPFYELKMDFRERQKFIKHVDQKMATRKIKGKVVPMTRVELAQELHMPVQSIYNFFSTEAKPRRFVAAAIANYFKLQRGDWLYDDKVQNGKIPKRVRSRTYPKKDIRKCDEGTYGDRPRPGGIGREDGDV